MEGYINGKKVNAVILAGGEGRRMMPLTAYRPKPLIDVGGERVIDSLLKLLKKNGITDAALTLGYRAGEIERYLGREKHGVSLTYFVESSPLGSAGGVKNAARFAGDFVIVLCGDAICDIDLYDAAEECISKNADAAVITAASDSPLEYGVVVSDEDHRIVSFSEKPSWSGVCANTVNTGIYILKRSTLDLIPDGKCDFGRDFFARMLEKGMYLRSYRVPSGSWRDIGDPDSYFKCVMSRTGGENYVDPTASIGKNCEIRSSIILEKAVIGDQCVIEGAIIGENAQIGDNVSVMSGSLIGPGCVVSDLCRIGFGCSVSEDSSLARGASLKNPLYLKSPFDVRRLTLFHPDSVELSSLGAAIGRAGYAKKIFFSPDHSSRSEDFFKGLLYSEPYAENLGAIGCHAASFLGAKFGGGLILCPKYSEEDDEFTLFVFDKYGCYPGAGFESKIRSQLRFPLTGVRDRIKEPIMGESAAVAEYAASLASDISCDLSGVRVTIYGDPIETRPLKEAIENCSGKTGDDGDIFVKIPDTPEDGCEIVFDGVFFDGDHVKAVCMLAYLKKGIGIFALPYRSPEALKVIAKANGASLANYSLSSFSKEDISAKELLHNTPALIDPCRASALFLDFVRSEDMSGTALMASLPTFSSVNESERIPYYKKIALAGEGGFDNEGFLLRRKNGSVRLVPENGNNIALLAEAADLTNAADLIAKAKKYLKGLGEKE